MIKVVFGEPNKDQKVVVPIHSNELYERIVVNIQNLKEENNCIFVPAIFGNFDQVLTRQGIYNLFHVAFLDKRIIYIPNGTKCSSQNLKDFLKFLASLEDEVIVITTDLAFFELANELKYLPGFADNNYSLLLVDLHNFLHRSYHALPERLDDKGNVITLVHAIDALIKWIEASKYSHVAFCSDSKTNLRKRYTEEIFPNDQNKIYKGNRKYNDENLKRQIIDVEKYIAQKGYKVIAVQGYEADDVIASFIKEFKNIPVHVYSNDKDFCSLFTYRNFRILDKNRKILNADYVVQKFGVSADLFLDFQALVGDKSDNVPGVKGIGAKNAAKLLDTYGNLRTLLAASYDMKGRIGELLRNSKDDILLSYDLIRMRSDLIHDFNINILKKVSNVY